MKLRAHRTVPFVDGLEIVPSHPQRDWMNATPFPPNKDGSESHKPGGFANRCLPLLMANQIGWEIRTTRGYVITTLDNGMHVTLPKGQMPIQGAPQNNFLNSIVTWPVPWNFETPEGWDLLIMPPTNTKLPAGVTALSAIVETDHAPVTFTINWLIEPKTAVFIEEGQPLVTIVPFPVAQVEGWDFVEDDVVPAGHAPWAKRRRESSDRMNENFGRWDKDYWNEAKRRKIKKGQHKVVKGGSPLGLPQQTQQQPPPGCPAHGGM